MLTSINHVANWWFPNHRATSSSHPFLDRIVPFTKPIQLLGYHHDIMTVVKYPMKQSPSPWDFFRKYVFPKNHECGIVLPWNVAFFLTETPKENHESMADDGQAAWRSRWNQDGRLGPRPAAFRFLSGRCSLVVRVIGESPKIYHEYWYIICMYIHIYIYNIHIQYIYTCIYTLYIYMYIYNIYIYMYVYAWCRCFVFCMLILKLFYVSVFFMMVLSIIIISIACSELIRISMIMLVCTHSCDSMT